MKKKFYYFTFAIILMGVVISIGCREEDLTDIEKTSDSKTFTNPELLLQLDPRLRNVQDFSDDKDMVEFTKLMDETMEFTKANVYKSLREKKKIKKVTIPRNTSKSDLQRIYLEVGRRDEFEKLSATFDKQATFITSFMKRHPELSKLGKYELSLIFLKVFKLNQIRARQENVSIYRKVQELEILKCQESYDNDSQANDNAYFNEAAGATAAYAVAEAACLAAGPGYPVCYAAATVAYGIALLVIEENYQDGINTAINDFNICMSGLSRGVSG